VADENENYAESSYQMEMAESGNCVRDGELLMGQQTAFDCWAKQMPCGISDQLEFHHAG
jgi:hypothetical protein